MAKFIQFLNKGRNAIYIFFQENKIKTKQCFRFLVKIVMQSIMIMNSEECLVKLLTSNTIFKEKEHLEKK